MSTWPLPILSAGRLSKGTRCGCCSCSSAESSMVRMRSSGAMNCESTLSSEVFPEPVPPATTMLSRSPTAASSSRAILGVKEPIVRSFAAVSRSGKNLRMAIVVPRRAIGASTTWMRLPSGRRASSRGRSSVRGRPTYCAMLRAAASRPSSLKVASVRCSLPCRSTQTSRGPLMRISLTSGSSRKAATGLRKARRLSENIVMAALRA